MMFVKVKNKGQVFYDADQKINIADRITEVKSSTLISALVREGKLIEVDEPSKAVKEKYAKEDKAIADRKAKVKPAPKPIDGQLKAANAKVVTISSELSEATENLILMSSELVATNLKLTDALIKIADLEEQLKKVGDPKSTETEETPKTVEQLAAEKKAGTAGKKETTSVGDK